MTKPDIRNYTLDELKGIMSSLDEPVYRAGQVFEWLHKKGANSFSDMSNLSSELREKLEKKFTINQLKLLKLRKSKDKTEKYLFGLADRESIETVMIPSRIRRTICVSTQVGCRFKCSFCESGKHGFKRNLWPSEIVNQVLFLIHQRKHKITNLVFMGIGEPLDNFENLKKAIYIINDKKGINLGSRKITVSTVGIVPMIKKIKDLGKQVELSVSLHAPDDTLRNKLVPINKKYPLDKLIKTLKDYSDQTRREVTFEYTLIKGVNDSPETADKLIKLLKGFRNKVNIIPQSGGEETEIDAFTQYLNSKGLKAIVRTSRGGDIEAACGQLKAGV